MNVLVGNNPLYQLKIHNTICSSCWWECQVLFSIRTYTETQCLRPCINSLFIRLSINETTGENWWGKNKNSSEKLQINVRSFFVAIQNLYIKETVLLFLRGAVVHVAATAQGWSQCWKTLFSKIFHVSVHVTWTEPCPVLLTSKLTNKALKTDRIRALFLCFYSTSNE